MATAAAFWPCFTVFHCFFGISRLIIIHLIALGLCVCLMFSCSPHLQEQPRMPAAQPQHIQNEAEKTNIIWDGRFMALSWACHVGSSYQSYQLFTVYLYATKVPDWHGCRPCPPLRRAEMLAINFPVPNRLQLVEKSSFQVGKGSRRNGGRGFGGLLRRYLED